MPNYSVNIQWSDEDEGYIAVIPELPGVSAFGETPEEAVKEIELAKNAMLKVYEEDGCKLPEPETLKTYSGQTRIRIEKTLHAALSQEAKSEGVSLNTHISNLLENRHVLVRFEKRLSTMENRINSVESMVAYQVMQGRPYSMPSSGLTNSVSCVIGERFEREDGVLISCQ